VPEGMFGYNTAHTETNTVIGSSLCMKINVGSCVSSQNRPLFVIWFIKKTMKYTKLYTFTGW
jgi:hypothetical protein